MPNKPTAGEVFRYPFLWKREELSGETEGRKKRPVCIAVTVAKQDGETVVFILPISFVAAMFYWQTPTLHQLVWLFAKGEPHFSSAVWENA